ncbi:MAG: CehA/McbA family metallohydrolase [Isosphaeraceae bacterium]
MTHRFRWTSLTGLLLIATNAGAVEYRAVVVDARTRQPLAARIYIEGPRQTWHFVDPAEPGGTAVPYREQWVPMPGSVERHTTITPHGFRIDLKPGTYRLTIERGKEYLPLERSLNIEDHPISETLELRRWANLADHGWYSGETHVHRRIEELPQVMLAEDLNVAFPVTFWTTVSDQPPSTAPSNLRPTPDPLGARRDVGSDPVKVDSTHVILPRNTEYEIFSVAGRRQILGALFILNHRSRFQDTLPPVASLAERAHQEGALLDLDKHNWPWSFMLVPVARVDLYELANNSVWRTEFGFRSSLVTPPDWMKIDSDAHGMTEWGWLDFGFQTYYALLNCGFHLSPTAGTASGVHPVPLGYGRVYVHLDGPFRVEDWLAGLKAGRSFVTTGPLLRVTANSLHPGHTFRSSQPGLQTLRIEGEALSARPLDRIELVVNGQIESVLKPVNEVMADGGYRSPIVQEVGLNRSGWVAIRCFERQPDGRVRFAHTGPFHVEVGGELVRPRRREVEWFIARMREELERNRTLRPDESLSEYRQALAIFEQIRKRAVD